MMKVLAASPILVHGHRGARALRPENTLAAFSHALDIGVDGFELQGSSSLSLISRDPLDLVAQACNANHQYPDGFMLFLGTMFAPTQDRFGPGLGFTHAVGDTVSITTPRLGTLTNRVNHTDQIAPWSYGLTALMRDLARRQLLN